MRRHVKERSSHVHADCPVSAGSRSLCHAGRLRTRPPLKPPQVCDFPPREKARLGAQQQLSHLAAGRISAGTAHELPVS